ncbi:hypothetical protein C0557_21320 [Kosakonia sp. MUSA4]|nr:hypothetical protein C0557_21320 [Kosakonia sp. MUSA4]
MDNILVLKAIVVAILALWAIDVLRTKRRKQHSDPAIAEANARERHDWRYFRWGFRIMQIACALYFILSAIKFILA